MRQAIWSMGLALLVAGCAAPSGRAGSAPSAPASGAATLSNEAFAVTEAHRDGSAIAVRGRASVFEATFDADVLDASGAGVAHAGVHASAGAPAWGDFTARLPLPAGAPTSGLVLRLYERSAKDGSPVHALTVPLT